MTIPNALASGQALVTSPNEEAYRDNATLVQSVVLSTAIRATATSWRSARNRLMTWFGVIWFDRLPLVLQKTRLKRSNGNWLRGKLDDLEREKYERLVWSLDRADTIRQVGRIGADSQAPYPGRYTAERRVL